MKALLLSPGHAHFEGHLGTLQELPEVEGILIWGEDQAALAFLEQAGEKKVESITTRFGRNSGTGRCLFCYCHHENGLEARCLYTDIGIRQTPNGRKAGRQNYPRCTADCRCSGTRRDAVGCLLSKIGTIR